MDRVDAVRSFNRFYTQRIGALRDGLLDSPFTLPEARVLYEVSAQAAPTATRIGAALGIDAGYLSRLLRSLERRGMLARRRAGEDARRKLLALTPRGRRAFAALEQRTRGEGRAAQPVVLRSHRPGDMGWVIGRHGALYAAEYGWDERFEALVAGIAKDFVQKLDPQRERCWIAERDGEPLGCVFLVKKSAGTAQLRLLIVDPAARGQGLGRRLVEECIRFASGKGYRKLVLWTQSNLGAARAIYRKCGFELVRTQSHRDFGVPLTGEYWELRLPRRGT